MTSQGIILTRRNAIIASDRQITMADGKTYGGIDKIFELSDVHSAGLMFNGISDFENVPIETLIGEFRNETDFKKIKTIDEIKNEFIEFLSKNTGHTSTDKFLEDAVKSFKENLRQEFDDYGFEKTINLKKRKEMPEFVEKFTNFDNAFDDIIPDGENNEEYNAALWEIFSFELQYDGTGIVIAGFNLKSHYPSFVEINIYCNDGGKVIFEEIDSVVDCEEPFIKVFAINEEAYTFITGVSEQFIRYVLDYIHSANEFIITNLKWKLEKENFEDIDEIIEIIRNTQNDEYFDISNEIDNLRLDAIKTTSYSIDDLPEWVLCIFAELLIRLTAVKQKTSSDIESVSISTDILIMTKINGLKWIRNNQKDFKYNEI